MEAGNFSVNPRVLTGVAGQDAGSQAPSLHPLSGPFVLPAPLGQVGHCGRTCPGSASSKEHFPHLCALGLAPLLGKVHHGYLMEQTCPLKAMHAELSPLT